MTDYLITAPERLRSLCIAENWFTNGDNEQYKTLFFMNLHPKKFTLKDIAIVIWICSTNDNLASLEFLSHILHILEETVKAWKMELDCLHPCPK